MCICMTWAHLIKIIRTPFQPKWQHVEHIDPMLTQIHPIVFLRPLIKQEWPAESNDSLQRYQDNLSSAKYLNLAPGGPQSIHTACFDGYIGAPPTQTLLWFPYACHGFPMVSNHFPAKGPYQTLRWIIAEESCFLHFPGCALKVR